jgi:hypothetical protein
MPLMAKDYKRVFAFYIGVDEGEKDSVLAAPTERNMKGLESMGALKDNDDVAIVAQIDEAHEDQNYRYDIQYLKTTIIPEKEIQTFDATFRYGEKDSGNPVTLKNYLWWLIQAYPAERYMLTLSGHSWGKLGIIEDFYMDGRVIKKATMIRNYELRRILEEVSHLAKTKLKRKPKFDILMADACNWAQLESTLEIANQFDYFIGTSLESPYFGVSFFKVLNPYIESLKTENDTPLHIEEKLLKPLVKSYLLEHQPGSDLAIAEKQIDVIQSVAIRLKALKTVHKAFEDMLHHFPKKPWKSEIDIQSFITNIQDADENLDIQLLTKVFYYFFTKQFKETNKVEWKIAADKAKALLKALHYRAPNPTLEDILITDSEAIGAWIKVEIDPYAKKEVAVCNALKSYVAINRPYHSPLPRFFDENDNEVFVHQKFCDAIGKGKHVKDGYPVLRLFDLRVVWPNKKVPAYYTEEKDKKFLSFWVDKKNDGLKDRYIYRLPGTQEIEIHYLKKDPIEYIESGFTLKKLRTAEVRKQNLTSVYYVDDEKYLGPREHSLYIAAGHSNGTLSEGLSLFVGKKIDTSDIHNQGYLPIELIETGPYRLSTEKYYEFFEDLKREKEVTSSLLDKYSPFIKTLAVGQTEKNYTRAGFDFYRLHKISTSWANFLEGK